MRPWPGREPQLSAWAQTPVMPGCGFTWTLGDRPPAPRGSARPPHPALRTKSRPKVAQASSVPRWPSPAGRLASRGLAGTGALRAGGRARGARTERSRNDVHLWHDSVPVPNPSASGPVQPHRVDLIHEGDRPELVGHITELFQRAHGTCGDTDTLRAGRLGLLPVRQPELKDTFQALSLTRPRLQVNLGP